MKKYLSIFLFSKTPYFLIWINPFMTERRSDWAFSCFMPVFQYCNIAVLQTNIAILFLSISLLLQYFFKSSIGVLQYCKKLKFLQYCNTFEKCQLYQSFSNHFRRYIANVKINGKVVIVNKKCLEKNLE